MAGRGIERFVSGEGLTAEYEVEECREGGNAGFVHRLPVRVKYTNVKLTRPGPGQRQAGPRAAGAAGRARLGGRLRRHR